MFCKFKILICFIRYKPDVNPRNFSDQSFSPVIQVYANISLQIPVLLFQYRSLYTYLSTNELGMISFIVYLLDTSVRFFHVLISSFRYSAVTVQELSEQLPKLYYLVQLLGSLQSFYHLPTCFLYYRSFSRSLCNSDCS